ncbi:MAG TPA: monofunctional biosynthetic peptidoglycan transglycosylase [Cytophagales bacterium]|nr:monofunctional biosynthetic peptidoglycan transglycosylase [Cytophagales bacterium]
MEKPHSKSPKANTRKPKASKKKVLLRILVLFKKALILFFASSIGFTILYRYVDPFFTPLMVIRTVQQVFHGDNIRLKNTWVDLEEMSMFMPKAALAAEDQKFFQHNGFDFEAIGKAFERNQKSKKLRGGSTISQQTAKNVFLWSGCSWLRKGLETYFTVLIEFFWPKKRILEVYLNVIEMGSGIYGAEAASQYYYHKSCRKLTKSQAAAIASVFPLPLKWDPRKPSARLSKKQAWIKRQIDGVEISE